MQIDTVEGVNLVVGLTHEEAAAAASARWTTSYSVIRKFALYFSPDDDQHEVTPHGDVREPRPKGHIHPDPIENTTR